MGKILITGIHKPFPRLESIFKRLDVDRFLFTMDRGDDVMATLAFTLFSQLPGMKIRHGYVNSVDEGLLIRTFHPTDLAQGQAKLTPAVEMAICKAVLLASNLYTEDALELVLNPPIEKVVSLLEGKCRLMVDIETPHTNDKEDPEDDPSFTIQRVGVSWAPGKAFSVPWAPPYTDVLRRAFSSCTELQFWNKYFDWPRLKANDVHSSARIVDAQEAWHFLYSDLPRALGFAAPFLINTPAWKHLSSDQPEFYNAKDTAVQSLMYQRIRAALAQRGSLQTFDRHCIEAGTLLSTMGYIAVDPERQNAFMLALDKSLKRADAELQGMVPPECMPGSHHKKPRPMPFNPRSTDQVSALCLHLGIKLPEKGTKTAKGKVKVKYSTDAKYLRAAKNATLNKILECRESSKILSTYNYKLDADGLVHTTYTFKPSTWRKASQDPNLQNIPNRSALASDFKRMFIARSGYTLLEADSSAIEAVIVGYCAESPSYIRLAKAGVHGWLCSAFSGSPVSLDLPDEQLKSECVAWKQKDKKLYDKMKRVIHLSNYMGTGHRMAVEYPNDFKTPRAAYALQDFYYGTEPGKAVCEWHKSCVARAAKEHYLDNHFGYRHYFYSVYKYSSFTGQYKYGEDACRAIAYVPQSDASAIQTEILLSLPNWMRYSLRLIVHDSILLEVPTTALKEFADELRKRMTQPFPQLGGLSIGCELKTGPNWGEMEVL
jgi:hypothetical protein